MEHDENDENYENDENDESDENDGNEENDENEMDEIDFNEIAEPDEPEPTKDPELAKKTELDLEMLEQGDKETEKEKGEQGGDALLKKILPR